MHSILKILNILGLHAVNVDFISAPNADSFVECGNNVDLKWQHTGTRTVVAKTWYLVKTTGAREQIAYETPSKNFIVNAASLYPPARAGRITYLANAGLRITNAQATDEATLFVEVDYSDFSVSAGGTNPKVTSNDILY